MPYSIQSPLNTLATEWRACKGDVPPPLVGAAVVVVDEDDETSIRHERSASSSLDRSTPKHGGKGRMFLFAGRLASNRKMTNDLYCLDLGTLVWTKIAAPPPPVRKIDEDAKTSSAQGRYPVPRYFHSCDLWRGKLVIFGGMGYHSKSSRMDMAGEKSKDKGADPLFVMDELLLFDLATMRWDHDYIAQPGPVRAPAPRYAHLSAITGDSLVVIGGQNISNKYVEEINVFDLVQRRWTLCETLDRQCGSYRSLAVSPPWILESYTGPSHLAEATATRKRSGSKGSAATNLSGHRESSPSIGRARGNSNVSSMAPYDATHVSAQPMSGTNANAAHDARLMSASDSQHPGEDRLNPKGTISGAANAPSLQPLPMSRPVTKQDDHPSLYVYSNYNFTDVKRELEIIKVSKAKKQTTLSDLNGIDDKPQALTLQDHSASMQGAHATAGLPPGLRFPTGVIIGDYLLVSGTYLANTSQAFSIWSLYLPKLIWSRLDLGPLINQGSWNRATVSAKRGQMFIFGNRERDLVTDYNHRQSNWDHMLTFDLEAWGISQPPLRPTSDEGLELGLQKLETAMASSVYQSLAGAFAKRRSNFNGTAQTLLDSRAWFSTLPDDHQEPPLLPGVLGTGGDFEIMCSDDIKIGCDRVVLEARWPWFRQKLARYRAHAKAAADLVQTRREEHRAEGNAPPPHSGNRSRANSKERAVAALQAAASEEDGHMQSSSTALNNPQASGEAVPSVDGAFEEGDWRFTPRQLHLSEPSAVVLALLQFFYTRCICTSLQRHPSVVASLLVFSRLYGLEDTLGKWARHAANVLLGGGLIPDALNTAGVHAESVAMGSSRSGEATAHSATNGLAKDVTGMGLMSTVELGNDLPVEECHRLSVALYEAAGVAGYEAVQVRALRNITALAKYTQRQAVTRTSDHSAHARSSSQGNSSSQMHGQQSSSALGYPGRPAEPVRANTSSHIPMNPSTSPNRAVRPSSSGGLVGAAALRRPIGGGVGNRALRPSSSSGRMSGNEDSDFLPHQRSYGEEGDDFGRSGGRARGNGKVDRILGLGGEGLPGREDGNYHRKNTGGSIGSVGSNASGVGNLASAGAGRKRFSLFGRGGSVGGEGTGASMLAGEDVVEREEEGSGFASAALSRNATSGSVGKSSGGHNPGKSNSSFHDGPNDAGMGGRLY
ncbi:hypothetical protein BCV69DRAFT_282908 [Microstroma glucosiphilum]|uniref:Galactose oxidase n=1 Tax=Pseudomicrostroma glucosiphilum TaxID=1684307 RepID=A0A316U634_9BASI|nr:hypothetical protein BCV69DRAFT_282908 [Pseudomicrostroma glucosiphilum]PWN20689.1 hypothetical protein BCV69DRAFT_282908 [Pseudomicrostroma glucosiphilum]